MTRRQKIMIVEDDPDLRECLAHLVEYAGYQVDTARHGAEALEALQREPNGYDLVLLDLLMPVMDGYAFRQVQQQDPRLTGIPVVVLSGAKQRNDGSLDATRHLDKPIDLEDLLITISSLCGPPAPVTMD